MRLFDLVTAGRVHVSGFFSFPVARASARLAVFSSVRALDAAIAAASFARREPNEDGERIVVFCSALGGSFIYSRQEVERRIAIKFPCLVLDEVAAAARFLEDRVRAHVKPMQDKERRATSWIGSWRGDY